ncbi:hypothetical protein EVJ58_g11029 [Rhodofomes roseus]|uniref:Proteasome beta subunit C-terminal domain-containing protein n=1 Tax=Rhodofomes roseus TaxID=34475 RepID=A0A4Y9XKK2_9APHY|nr:hypothetical protein EVJ58_g11029 [Rhodofomes roseus]
MATASAYRSPGFDFSNEIRNNFLSERGVPLPKATSTGTTIVGCLFKDGIVLGADTRATEGPIVADKNCEKIHFITDSIRCCGAGTAADTEFTTAMISSNMELHALSTGRKPRVVTAMTMLKQYLFRLAAMAVFEAGWRPNMERAEALDLVTTAVSAGIFNDLGSGSNVDACVITASHTEMLRNYVKPNERVQKERSYGFRRGTTAWKSESIRQMVVEEDITFIAPEAMDTS